MLRNGQARWELSSKINFFFALGPQILSVVKNTLFSLKRQFHLVCFREKRLLNTRPRHRTSPAVFFSMNDSPAAA